MLNEIRLPARVLTEKQMLSAGINPAIYKAYLHIRYAPSATPTDEQMSTEPNDFMGVYCGDVTAPTTASSYVWARINSAAVQAAVEAAMAAAQQAQASSEAARDEAVGARDSALGAEDAAALSATEAWAAKTGAEAAESGAEAAKDTSVEARTGAVAANEAAQEAKGEALAARNAAAQSKEAAAGSASGAESAKTAAELAATNAAGSEVTATQKAGEASVSAGAAAQSEAAAGTAKTAAEAAKTAAAASAGTAQVKAGEASSSATAAAGSAAEAAQYAEAAGSAHPPVNVIADTTSAASPGAGGTFAVVDGVVRNALGHVEKVNLKTVTMPEVVNPVYATGDLLSELVTEYLPENGTLGQVCILTDQYGGYGRPFICTKANGNEPAVWTEMQESIPDHYLLVDRPTPAENQYFLMGIVDDPEYASRGYAEWRKIHLEDVSGLSERFDRYLFTDGKMISETFSGLTLKPFTRPDGTVERVRLGDGDAPLTGVNTGYITLNDRLIIPNGNDPEMIISKQGIMKDDYAAYINEGDTWIGTERYPFTRVHGLWFGSGTAPGLPGAEFSGDLLGTASEATRAIKDDKNQNIASTYIKDISIAGKVLTMTRGDNVASTITMPSAAGCYTAALPSAGWVGSEAPYSKTITVSGMMEADAPVVDIVQTGTEETDAPIREAWSAITRITTGANSITVYASEVPSTAVPIQIKVVR